ncbi:MAG: amino acid ABC transporter permease, partial [Planctomycetota bacterium]
MMIAATEMSVADLHSVRTVADQFYLFYAAAPTRTAIAMTVVVPWMLAVPMLVACRIMLTRSNASSSDYEINASTQKISHGHFIGAFIVLLCSLVLIVILPGLGMLIQAGHEVEIVDGQRRVSWSIVRAATSIWGATSLFGREYFWTALLSGLTTLLVLPIAWVTSSLVGRRLWGTWIDVLVMLLFLVPGPIVGLFWTACFAGGDSLRTYLATQTLVPTVLAVVVRAFVVAYLILRIGWQTTDPDTLRSARLDGGVLWRSWCVHLPFLVGYLRMAAVASVIVSSGDVPATLPVVPPGVSTVGTRLFGLLHSGARFQEASLAFWYLLAVVILACLANPERRSTLDD